MRSKAFLLVACLLAGPGCLAQRPPAEDPSPEQEPVRGDAVYFLKADYSLSPVSPSKATPDRVPANPMINGFANEDLRAFTSDSVAKSLNVTRVKLIAYYEVVAPTLDPFVNTSNPAQARQIVFWIGSGGKYPASVSTMGDTIVVPNRVYRAEAEIPLPEPGWIVAASEPLQLLVATLAFNDDGAELRFLVDADQTPSRIELTATVAAEQVPKDLEIERQEYEIVANSGLFTGATGDQLPSRVRVPITVAANDEFLEVRALFRTNAGGKSDLDMDVLAPGGRVATASSTPFQSETARLFSSNLRWHGPGTYVADIVAYSGVSTRFTLEIVRSASSDTPAPDQQ